MKLIISIITMTLAMSLNMAIANNGTNPLNDSDKTEMCNNEVMSYDIATEYTSFLESAKYDQANDYLSLKTFQKVELLQIINAAGELEFQLPIYGNQIHISLKDFSIGTYSVNLKFEGEKNYLSSELIKK